MSLWITMPIAMLLSYFLGVALVATYGGAGLLVAFPTGLALGWTVCDLTDL